jgi:hypothetical protein
MDEQIAESEAWSGSVGGIRESRCERLASENESSRVAGVYWIRGSSETLEWREAASRRRSIKAERCFMGSGPIAFMIGKGISEHAVAMSDWRRVARVVRAGMEKGTPLAVISTQFQMVEEKWEMQKEESLSPR